MPSSALRVRRHFYFPGGISMGKRIGVIGIVIDEPKQVMDKVNAIISSFGHMVIGRMGVPRHEANVGVIALIIEGTTDEVGAMTGRLGNIRGITVKSALTGKSLEEEK
jgi:putative iron-only hydrogenase system regulator